MSTTPWMALFLGAAISLAVFGFTCWATRSATCSIRACAARPPDRDDVRVDVRRRLILNATLQLGGAVAELSRRGIGRERWS